MSAAAFVLETAAVALAARLHPRVVN